MISDDFSFHLLSLSLFKKKSINSSEDYQIVLTKHEKLSVINRKIAKNLKVIVAVGYNRRVCSYECLKEERRRDLKERNNLFTNQNQQNIAQS